MNMFLCMLFCRHTNGLFVHRLVAQAQRPGERNAAAATSILNWLTRIGYSRAPMENFTA